MFSAFLFSVSNLRGRLIHISLPLAPSRQTYWGACTPPLVGGVHMLTREDTQLQYTQEDNRGATLQQHTQIYYLGISYYTWTLSLGIKIYQTIL